MENVLKIESAGKHFLSWEYCRPIGQSWEYLNPITLKINRKQFPIVVCFAMAINKSQGQSLSHVGLFLPHPVFTHGQLYVALSRSTSPRNIHVLLPEGSDGTTTNIVYPEVLID